MKFQVRIVSHTLKSGLKLFYQTENVRMKSTFTTEADAIHAAGEDSGDHSPGQGAKRRSPESSPAA